MALIELWTGELASLYPESAFNLKGTIRTNYRGGDKNVSRGL